MVGPPTGLQPAPKGKGFFCSVSEFPDSEPEKQGGVAKGFFLLASGWDIQGPPRAENGATQKLHFPRVL